MTKEKFVQFAKDAWAWCIEHQPIAIPLATFVAGYLTGKWWL